MQNGQHGQHGHSVQHGHSGPTTTPCSDSWRHIFLTLHGRVTRRTFWTHGVAALIGAAIYLHLLAGIVGVPRSRADWWINLVLLLPALAVSAKRWQDRDRSPWWALIALVPVIGWLWALVDNGFVRGTPGPNRFGAPPQA